jgi:hypothetical protein
MYIAAVILFIAVILLSLALYIVNKDYGRRLKEKQLKKQQEEYLTRQEKVKQEQFEKEQGVLYSELAVLAKDMKVAVDDILLYSGLIESSLKNAEFYFNDGAYSPFWNEIDNVVNNLSGYNTRINKAQTIADKYIVVAKNIKAEKRRKGRKELPKLISCDVSNANMFLSRLNNLIYEAQRRPTFAIIYEQRMTNKTLVAGFNNLDLAIYNIGSQISDSVRSFGNTFDSAVVSLSERSNEYHSELIENISEIYEHMIKNKKKI